MGGKTLFCGGAKKKDKFFNKTCSSGVPWWSSDWLHAPNAGVPSSIPGQGARFHKLQLTVCMLQLKRILHITTKSWHNQINKYLLKQNKSFFFKCISTLLITAEMEEMVKWALDICSFFLFLEMCGSYLGQSSTHGPECQKLKSSKQFKSWTVEFNRSKWKLGSCSEQKRNK